MSSEGLEKKSPEKYIFQNRGHFGRKTKLSGRNNIILINKYIIIYYFLYILLLYIILYILIYY